jgi:phosphatidylserine decarboxylase
MRPGPRFPHDHARRFGRVPPSQIESCIQKVLAAWAQFLDSPASLYVLNETPAGWLCPAALEVIHLDEYVHGPKAPFYGFQSWNDFFIRRFKPGARPVAEPHNPKAIVNACESAPFTSPATCRHKALSG